jgi:hypothetical protein
MPPGSAGLNRPFAAPVTSGGLGRTPAVESSIRGRDKVVAAEWAGQLYI